MNSSMTNKTKHIVPYILTWTEVARPETLTIWVILHRIQISGPKCLNIASGKVTSFKNIAEITNQITKNKKKILRVERKGPMPHNGYRPFLIKKIKNNFKEIKITSIKDGIKNYYLGITR